MVENSRDLEGNIQINMENDQEESKQGTGFRPEGQSGPSQAGRMGDETFNTLDEPVSETIVSRFPLKKSSASSYFRLMSQTIMFKCCLPCFMNRNETWSASGKSYESLSTR